MIHAVASVSVGQKMTYELGSDLFLHLQRMSLLFHAGGRLGTRLHESRRTRIASIPGDREPLLPLLQSALTVIAMFVIMLQLDVTLTLLSLGVLPFLVLPFGPLRNL